MAQQQQQQLRMRNQFVVSSSSERRHAVTLYVHIREQDVRHFNSSAVQETKSDTDSINYIEHVLELLDADSNFEAAVRELDVMRTAEDMAKSSSSSKSAQAMKSVASPLVQVQWRVLDQSHRGLANVLQLTHRRRDECFAREEKDATSATKSKAKQATVQDEMYTGGMYAPVPMRRLAIEAWLYPPHVVIPATGDRIPENSSSDIDFFHADDGDK